ncbi:hypothetical protein FBQ97_09505 [Acidobacteria bacterium ACD]|nr:MAG: hypothetical protein EDX89_00110 [Acidobacteriota bacterium]MCE7958275.1 hypothetical protein [Acidobacteria bacterium ACB2]MDL1950032.1 hypothetical protein [Acidobacteria bacterium ACD]
MSGAPPRPHAPAFEVAARFQPSPEAKALLAPDIPARDYVDRLVAEHHYNDAVTFVAHWLPKRDGVFWACLATRQSMGEETPRKERAALEAAERWLEKLDEPSRRACEAAAQALDHTGAAAMAANAAFWTGGSLAPPDLPAVPPQEFMSAKGVAASVLAAGTVPGRGNVVKRLRELIALGVEIVDGKRRPGGGR